MNTDDLDEQMDALHARELRILESRAIDWNDLCQKTQDSITEQAVAELDKENA